MRSSKPVFESEAFQYNYQSTPKTPQSWRRKSPLEFEYETIDFQAKSFPFQSNDLRYKNFEFTLSTKDYLPRILFSQNISAKLKKLATNSITGRDLSLFVTSQVQDRESSRMFLVEDLAYRTNEIQDHLSMNSRDSYTLSYSYQAINDTESNVTQDTEIVSKLRNQLIEASRQCTSDLTSNTPAADTDNTEKSPVMSENALRQGEIDYLQMMRVFLVLIRNTSKPKDRQLTFHKLIYFPNAAFHLNLIQQPFKFIASPLTSYLTRHSTELQTSERKKKRNNITFGYLCIDKNLRILPIMPNDPLTSKVPLIGVWVFGLSSTLNKRLREDELQHLITVLLRYVTNKSLLERQYSMSPAKMSFMIVLFSHDESAQFYEVQLVKDYTKSGEPIANQWTLLKNSESLADVSEISSHPLSFSFNPNLLIKDLNQLQDGLLKTPRSNRKMQSSTELSRHTHNSSLDQYLSFDNCIQEKQTPRGSQHVNVSQTLQIDSAVLEDDEDFECQFSLPKPQPKPQAHFNTHSPSRNFESSRHSHRTATFLNTNDQTFTPDAIHGLESNFASINGRSSLADSYGALDQPLTNSEMRTSRQQRAQQGQHEEKLSPFAEKMLQQQAQQLQLLQQQILGLQMSLFNQNNKGMSYPYEAMEQFQALMQAQANTQAQMNPMVNFQKPLDINALNSLQKPPKSNTVTSTACGEDGPVESFRSQTQTNTQGLQKALNPLTLANFDSKKFVTKSTNTTFCVSKTDLSANMTLTAPGTSVQIHETDTSVNVIASKFEDLMPENSFQKAAEDNTKSMQHFPTLLSKEIGLCHSRQDTNKVLLTDNSRIHNTSAVSSERLQFSLSKIQTKDLETENDDRSSTEDEMILRMANLSHRDTNPHDSCKSSTLPEANFPTFHPEEPNYWRDSVQKHHLSNKENTDCNRRSPAVVRKKFLVEDSNETLADELASHITKLRTPDELLSSSAKPSTKKDTRTTIMNSVDQSDQSLKIPRIKYDFKAMESDSSDDNVKKLELKYFNRK